MREQFIEKKFTDAVKKMGGIAPKFVSPGLDGVPDRLVLLPMGRMAFVEFKAPGKKMVLQTSVLISITVKSLSTATYIRNTILHHWYLPWTISQHGLTLYRGYASLFLMMCRTDTSWQGLMMPWTVKGLSARQGLLI